jgi:hypothetical protein
MRSLFPAATMIAPTLAEFIWLARLPACLIASSS